MSTVDFHQSIFQQTRRAGWQSRWPAPAPPPAWSPPTPAATGPSCVGSALLQHYHHHNHHHSCNRDQLQKFEVLILVTWRSVHQTQQGWLGVEFKPIPYKVCRYQIQIVQIFQAKNCNGTACTALYVASSSQIEQI